MLPYILLAGVIAAFAGGYCTAYKIEHGEVEQLRHEIVLSNLQAEETLKSIQDRVKTAQDEAWKSNEDLDNENKLHTIEVDSLRGNLDIANSISRRMRTGTHNKDCRSTLPKSTTAEQLKEASTESAEFSEKFGHFLAAESVRADQLAVYAKTAYDFAADNCGIK